MIRNLERHLLPAGHRKWVGNNAKGRHHQNKVSRTETQLYIHLSWKAASGSPAQFVGCYELDMVQLLAHGYLRTDGPDAVRLRFFHADDGNIYIHPLNGLGYYAFAKDCATVAEWLQTEAIANPASRGSRRWYAADVQPLWLDW